MGIPCNMELMDFMIFPSCSITVMVPWLPVITGYFNGIIHSIHGVVSTYNYIINGHNCIFCVFVP